MVAGKRLPEVGRHPWNNGFCMGALGRWCLGGVFQGGATALEKQKNSLGAIKKTVIGKLFLGWAAPLEPWICT